MAITAEVTAAVSAGRRRTRMVAGILAAGVVANVGLLAWVWQWVQWSETIVSALFWAPYACLFIFLYWAYRTAKLTNLVNGDHNVSHVWLVFSFFIPIGSLWLPVKHMRELDRAVDPEPLPLPVRRVEHPDAGYREPAVSYETVGWARLGTPLKAWWGTWIASATLKFVAGKMADYDTWVMFLTLGVSAAILSGLLSIVVVRRIDARLSERVRRLEAMPEDERAAA